MNLEHLSIDKDGFGSCNQCIFNEVKCVYAYEDPPTILAHGCKIRSIWCIAYHFLGDTHNPAMKMYKVMFNLFCLGSLCFVSCDFHFNTTFCFCRA